MNSQLLSFMPTYTDVLRCSQTFAAHDGLDSTFEDFIQHMDSLEKRLYGFGGGQFFTDLKNYLAIELVQDTSVADFPRYIVRSLAEPGSPPTYGNAKDSASRLCALYSAYRLLDFLALRAGLCLSAFPSRYIERGCVAPPAVLPPMVARLKFWPTVVDAFVAILNKEIRVGRPDRPTKRLDDDFERVLYYVNRERTSVKRSKITLNFLIASMHVSHMRRPAAEIPDLPNSVDDLLTRDRDESISEEDMSFLGGLVQSNRADAGKGTAGFRVPLQYALGISPLLLLLPYHLSKIRCDRSKIIQTSLALGSSKEPLLVEVERIIMEALFTIGDSLDEPDVILERLKDDLKSLSIAKHVINPTWFDLSTSEMSKDIEPPSSDGHSPQTLMHGNPLPETALSDSETCAASESDQTHVHASPNPDVGMTAYNTDADKELQARVLIARVLRTGLDVDVRARHAMADTNFRPILASPDDSIPSSVPMKTVLSEKEEDRDLHAQLRADGRTYATEGATDPNGVSGISEIITALKMATVQNSVEGSDTEIDTTTEVRGSVVVEIQSTDSPHSGDTCAAATETDVNPAPLSTSFPLVDEEVDSLSSTVSGENSDIASSPSQRTPTQVMSPKSSPLTDPVITCTYGPRSRQPQAPQITALIPRSIPPKNKRTRVEPALSEDKSVSTDGPDIHAMASQLITAGFSAHSPITLSKVLRILPVYSAVDYARKVTAPLQGLQSPKVESTRYSLFKPDGSLYEFDTAFHHTKDSNSFDTFFNAVGAGKASANSPRKPSYLADRENSNIRVITNADYIALGTSGIFDLLRDHCCVVVTGIPTQNMAFDEHCLKTLGPMRSTTQVYDLSVSIADDLPTEKLTKLTTLEQILEASRSCDGKSLHAFDFPMFSAPVVPIPSYSTDIMAWSETAGEPGFARENVVPVGQIRFGLVATRGALSYTHVDPNSKGTHIDVLTGAKVWIVEDGSPFENNRWRSMHVLVEPNLDLRRPHPDVKYEAIVLTPGTRLIMRPNTPHTVYTPEHTVCHGGHFYSTVTMQHSLYAAMHTFVGHFRITGRNHLHSGQFLRRIAMFYYVGLIQQKIPAPENEHLPTLSNLSGALDLLSLCWLVIMGNVLDHRTYLCVNQESDSEASYVGRLLKDRYDVNAIPLDERLHMSYARGLCYQIIGWFDSRYVVGSLDGDLFTPADAFGVHFLVAESYKLLHYSGIGVAEKMLPPPHCGSEDLHRQIVNVMEADATAETWKTFIDTLDPDDDSIQCIGWNSPDNLTYVVRERPTMLSTFCETEEVGALGTTPFDLAMVAQISSDNMKRTKY